MYLSGTSNWTGGNRAIRFLKNRGFKAKRDGSFWNGEHKALIRPIRDHNNQVEGYCVNELVPRPVQPGQVEFQE